MTFITGNKFLGIGKKTAENRSAYFLMLWKIRNAESDLCDKIRKTLVFISFLRSD